MLVIRTSLINKDNQIKVWDVWTTTLKPEGAQTTKKREPGSKPTKRLIVDLPGTVRFAILHGLLCNKSLLKTEGWSIACCQVDTYPGGTAVATPTSSLPSSFASALLSLPHISCFSPRDPKFNYCQAAVGGSSSGPAGRNSDTFPSSTVGKEKAAFFGLISNKMYE